MMDNTLEKEIDSIIESLNRLKAAIMKLDAKRTWYSADEAAEVTGLKRSTVIHYAKQGKYKLARKKGKRWFFHRDDISPAHRF
ncbi:MAG: helix-turn-helix domain-containing protein [Balneolales bacterium]|nr:helix-turn-helix domain-containing protein [Balneolales bacterium]